MTTQPIDVRLAVQQASSDTSPASASPTWPVAEDSVEDLPDWPSNYLDQSPRYFDAGSEKSSPSSM